MRIQSVFTNAPLRAKLTTKMITLAVGGRANLPEIIPLFMYKPEFFGKSFRAWVQRVLRGDSWWSVGEREVMAAYVSQTNACRFCVDSHRAVAELAFIGTKSDGAVAQVLADPTQGELRAELKAVLPMLEKLTRTPAEVTPADLERVRAAGVPQSAIDEAIQVCAIFCTINRIADALGFSVPDEAAMKKGGARLLTKGYE